VRGKQGLELKNMSFFRCLEVGKTKGRICQQTLSASLLGLTPGEAFIYVPGSPETIAQADGARGWGGEMRDLRGRWLIRKAVEMTISLPPDSASTYFPTYTIIVSWSVG
jgi:hypothetical protein